MAARKLQTEIERTLKKVAEGVEIFESIFEKISTATNAAQKEKFEGDLKKEIKKLQRYRDQIKTWMSSNEIKDKRALLDNRKLIESQMEKFKAMEKELKTKAFSKEGLLQPGKVDPEEAKRESLADWIRRTVESLQEMIDKLEFEQEQLLSTIKKNKKADPSKQDRLNSVEHLLERHKWHINKLEIILRLLENGNLTFDQVQSIQDDVSFYVESCDDEGFDEDEGIYDDLNLEEAGLYGLPADDEDEENDDSDAEPGSPRDREGSPEISPTPPAKEEKRKASKDIEVEPPKAAAKVVAPTPPLPPKAVERVASKDDGKAKPATVAPIPAAASTTSRPGSTTVAPSTPLSSITKSSPTIPASVPTPRDVVPPPQRYAAAASVSAAAATASSAAATSSITPSAASTITSAISSAADKVSPVRYGDAASAAISSAPIAASIGQPITTASVVGKPEISPTTAKLVPKETVTSPISTSQQPLQQQQSSNVVGGRPPATAAGTAATPSTIQTVPPASSEKLSLSQPSPTTSSSVASSQPRIPTTPEAPKDDQTVETVDKRLSDLVDSFEATKAKSLAAQIEPGYIHNMMETSFQYVPDASDSEKPKHYMPKSPYPTPGYYPQTPLALLENLAMFEKFDIDTLFFIFYYQQGTYQQYLAARELKRQSWRFHKKYLTWFQRHEEPKSITDEYEQGTYIYFDYEGAWCQRKKCEFRFDYRYLEDAELS
ncbi:hypothetical protein SmJEL517_g02476 [Synchytrium microbalum]|uniref:General negative regulator of transcription subunit n=1 Tax=Synchytrium microbalum TaxID=1806994 RepID=A0A507C0N8_9FUNG|nr:uncharacterized protein SmJEL517_g02476 [Synchytrium microbalum]TPX35100.1 hypothetical protein SmJEL517_g02476 [Synchytrium microbalum]